MDTIQQISFTSRYWIILLPLILIATDIVTGWIQATVNGTWDSTKMRKGLYRKSDELLVIILACAISVVISRCLVRWRRVQGLHGMVFYTEVQGEKWYLVASPYGMGFSNSGYLQTASK
ncbi:MAG: phage holin family protein [Blautia sp.]|nr:phage holin family protein [Blautia sp.]